VLLAYMALLVADGYPWLAPFRAQAHWYRITTVPPLELVAAIWAAIRGAGWIAGGTPFYRPTHLGPFSPAGQSIVLLVEMGLACALLVWSRRHLALEYVVYAAAVIVVLLCSSEPGQPLWSDDRYLLTIFPLSMAAGAWVAKRRLVVPAVAVAAFMLVFYTLQFSHWSFVA